MPQERTGKSKLTDGREVPMTENVITSFSVEQLEEDSPKHEEAVLSQKGLDVAQNMEITTSEVDAPLKADSKPDMKQGSADIVTEESITVSVTELQEKEKPMPEKDQQPIQKASFDFESKTTALCEEVLSSSGVGEFSYEIPELKTPTASHAVHISKQGEEITVHDNEINFSTILPVQTSADLSVLTGEHITIAHVETSEKENILQVLEQVDARTASENYIVRPVATVSEIISNNQIDELNLESPHAVSAIKDQLLYQSISTVEHNIVDSENILHKYKQPATRTLEITIDESSGLEIIETFASDKEKFFEDKLELDMLEAIPTQQLEGLPSAIVTHAITNESELSLEDMKETSKKTADTEIITHITTEVIETVGLNTVSTTSEVPLPSKQSVIANFKALGIVVTSEVVHSEAEENLVQKDLPIRSTVNLIMGESEATNISETIIIDSVDDFTGKIDLNGKQAVVNVNEFVPLETSEIATNEVEDVLEVAVAPVKVGATPAIRGQQVAETIKVESEMSVDQLLEMKIPNQSTVIERIDEQMSVLVSQIESNYDSDMKQTLVIPNELNAIIGIISKETAEVQEVLTMSSVEQFGECRILEGRGITKQDLISPVIVSETIPDEADVELTTVCAPEQKPKMQSLLNQEAIQTSENVALQDAPNLQNYAIPEEQICQKQISTKDSLLVLEVICDETKGTTADFKITKEESATKTLTHQEAASVSEVVCNTSVNMIAAAELPESAEVDFSIKQSIPVQVSEVEIHDTNVPLKDSVEMNLTMAEMSIKLQEVPQTSEIVTDSQLESLEVTTVPDIQKGEASVTPLLSLVALETLPNEENGLMTTQEVPDLKTASVTLKSRKGMHVSEVISFSSSTNFEGAPIIIGQQGQQEVEEFKHFQQSEMILAESESTFKSPEVSEEICQQLIILKDSAAVIEVETSDTVSKFDITTNVNVQEAQTAVNELLSLKITEVVSNEKENRILDVNVPKEVIVQTDILPIDELQTTQTTALSTVTDLEEIDLRKEQKPAFDMHLLPSALITQTNLTEQEDILDVTKEKEQFVNNQTLLENEALEISESITGMSSNDFIVKPLPKSTQGDTQIDTLKYLMVSEIISSEQEDRFEKDMKPATSEASESLTESGVIEISEITPYSKIEEIDQYDVGIKTTSELQLQESLLSTQITEISLVESEKSLKSAEVIRDETASIKISGHEAMEINETLSVLETGKLEKQRHPSIEKPSLELNEMASISILQTVLNESEKELMVSELKDEQKALLELCGQPIANKEEIISVQEVESFEITSTNYKRGTVTTDEIRPLVIMSHDSQDSEQEFQIQERFQQTSARSDIYVPDNAEISEIVVLTDTAILPEQPAIEIDKAKLSVNEIQPLTITEVFLEDKELNKEDILKECGIAKPNMTSFNMVPESSETYLSDTTGTLNIKEAPEERSDYTQESQLPMSITELTFGENEVNLKVEDIPGEKFAKTKICSHTAVQLHETTEISKTDEIKPQTVPDSKQILPENLLHTNIQGYVTNTIEETDTIKVDYPTFKKADILLEQEHFKQIGKSKSYLIIFLIIYMDIKRNNYAVK